LQTDLCGQSEREQTKIRLLIETPSGEEETVFDCVIDASGTWNSACWMGKGGAPAIGERALRRRLVAGELPDGRIYTCWTLFPEELDLCKGHRFLLVGSGFTAATNLVMLEAAREAGREFQCIWLTRNAAVDSPLTTITNDPLPYRLELAERANHLARSADWVDWRPGSIVQSVELDDDGFRMHVTTGERNEILRGDHLLSNTGFEGNVDLLKYMQVARFGAPCGSMAPAHGEGGDCLSLHATGKTPVATNEPGLFVIGAKSFGRDSRFLYATGLRQIRDVFRIIGGRETLDLYATTPAVGLRD
jgi:hypothetical protein